MQIIYPTNSLPDLTGSALILGCFNGIHEGHLALVNEAKNLNVPKIYVLSLARKTPKVDEEILAAYPDKQRIFYRLGVDEVIEMEADDAFYSLSPEEFLTQVLKPMNPAHLIVGEDYRFGHLRAGDPTTLAKYFPTHVVPLLRRDDEKISSRAIVSLLKAGEIDKANSLLCFPYEVYGTVVRGLQNGRKIGFPTANLALSYPYVLPKRGVYAGIVYHLGIAYYAILNVGINPTVGYLAKPQLEAHLLHFDREIYGDTLYVRFLRFLREEKKFPSLEELKLQIEKDLEAARECFQ